MGANIPYTDPRRQMGVSSDATSRFGWFDPEFNRGLLYTASWIQSGSHQGVQGLVHDEIPGPFGHSVGMSMPDNNTNGVGNWIHLWDNLAFLAQGRTTEALTPNVSWGQRYKIAALFKAPAGTLLQYDVDEFAGLGQTNYMASPIAGTLPTCTGGWDYFESTPWQVGNPETYIGHSQITSEPRSLFLGIAGAGTGATNYTFYLGGLYLIHL